ncbi:MAG: acyltransferase [Bacteroides thetaiotaomicron]|nr:acyltransferase [Bacteroides thetaiotaomicron]
MLQERNEGLDCAKGLAILSVICAHCNAVLDTSTRFADACSIFLQQIGTLGVICFFVISGYLFHYDKIKTKKFWLNKIKQIFIPWIISGTVVYLYVYLRKPPMSFYGWCNFLLGNGSYLYYLSILILLYAIFWFIPCFRYTSVQIACIAVSLVSIIWFPDLLGSTSYVNPFNWIGYFSVGMLLQQKKDFLKHSDMKWRICRWCIYIVTLFYIILLTASNVEGTYFGGLHIVGCILGGMSLLLLGQEISKKDNRIHKVLMLAGKNSLFFYLWHMPVAGIVARIMNYGFFVNFVFVRPLIVFSAVYVALLITNRLMKKLKIEHLSFVIGITYVE